jgi:hypothetical protein
MSKTITELMHIRAFLMDRLVREIAITYGFPVSKDPLPWSMKTVLADAAEMMIDDWVHYDFRHAGFISNWPVPRMIAEICNVDALIYGRSVTDKSQAPDPHNGNRTV